MDESSAAPSVAGLILAAAFATLALTGYLRRRRHASPRAKFVALVIGLAGVEAAMLPALLVAMFSGALDSRVGGWSGWSLAGGYIGLTIFVVMRLFPWREVEAMTAEPDAKLTDILRRLRRQ